MSRNSRISDVIVLQQCYINTTGIIKTVEIAVYLKNSTNTIIL